MKLSQIATIIPLLIVAIGLIGWILTVRNDVTSSVEQIDGIYESIDGIYASIDDITADIATIEQTLNNRIVELEKSLAIANDQMQTIMGDHLGFADVLRELGEAGVLPSGERRSYGGYGN